MACQPISLTSKLLRCAKHPPFWEWHAQNSCRVLGSGTPHIGDFCVMDPGSLGASPPPPRITGSSRQSTTPPAYQPNSLRRPPSHPLVPLNPQHNPIHKELTRRSLPCGRTRLCSALRQPKSGKELAAEIQWPKMGFLASVMSAILGKLTTCGGNSFKSSSTIARNGMTGQVDGNAQTSRLQGKAKTHSSSQMLT